MTHKGRLAPLLRTEYRTLFRSVGDLLFRGVCKAVVYSVLRKTINGRPSGRPNRACSPSPWSSCGATPRLQQLAQTHTKDPVHSQQTQGPSRCVCFTHDELISRTTVVDAVEASATCMRVKQRCQCRHMQEQPWLWLSRDVCLSVCLLSLPELLVRLRCAPCW